MPRSPTRGQRRLEAILHPLIGVEVERAAAAAPRSAGAGLRCPAAGRIGPLASARRLVWLVDCDEAVQVERVTARPAGAREAARAVIAQQASRARAAPPPTPSSTTGQSLDELAQEVRRLWDEVPRGRA